jgi:hypothetical protein
MFLFTNPLYFTPKSNLEHKLNFKKIHQIYVALFAIIICMAIFVYKVSVY